MQKAEERVCEKIDDVKDVLTEMAQYIFEQSVIGLKEFNSSCKIKTVLRKYGFTIEDEFHEMPIAFIAHKKMVMD